MSTFFSAKDFFDITNPQHNNEIQSDKKRHTLSIQVNICLCGENVVQVP